MIYENLLTGDEYEDEERAIEAVLEHMDNQDILDYANPDLFEPSKILEELARLESPLFFEIIESAQHAFLEQYLAEWHRVD